MHAVSQSFRNLTTNLPAFGASVRQSSMFEASVALYTQATTHPQQDHLFPGSMAPIQPLFHLGIELDPNQDVDVDVQNVLIRMVAAFNLTSLQYLRLEVNDDCLDQLSLESWRTALEPLVQLRTLELDWPLSMDIIPRLLTVTDNDPVLPSLRHICISGHLYFGNDEGSLPFSENFRMVLSRQRVGLALERIQMERIMLDHEEHEAVARILPRLRAVVPLVECGSDGSIRLGKVGPPMVPRTAVEDSDEPNEGIFVDY
ncbi:hypothetical protein K488DRAFT_90716 [Vararia minispora EC-137]|uniref:Uncharacterized protein n=1 Tax=Vararia minispora EC-137 TaxID=1314806 RepID=A0ACB8Q7H6_9AGAM|nr:hypothetical protein K488DRAFT_90716 [Vararia minispora EC-137]